MFPCLPTRLAGPGSVGRIRMSDPDPNIRIRKIESGSEKSNPDPKNRPGRPNKRPGPNKRTLCPKKSPKK